MRFLKRLGVLALLALVGGSASGRAQFVDSDPQGGAKLDQANTQKYKVGLTIRAVGGPCRGIVGTVPVPTDWPEQTVSIVAEDFSPSVGEVTYRTLANGVKQMVVSIPRLASREEAHALITVEFTRHSQSPPDDTSKYREADPEKLGKEFALYLNPSPYIESKHPRIVQLAKEAAEGKSGWEKVEALYDAARDRVEYRNGPMKGALRALVDGTGDCEELTSLVVALCRAAGVPARCVWVPEHCYAEFYLVDDQGAGFWFPCQPAGDRSFGGIVEFRPVLQKGDNFRDPDRPKEKLRYVSEYLKGLPTKNGGDPKVTFIREPIK